MRAVLVTRPRPAADALAARLRREGFSAIAAPLMEYEETAAPLPGPETYQALAFTSAQGVRVFAAREAAGRDKPAFCVGEATAAAARQAGFGNVHAAEGDAAALAKLVLAQKDALGIGKILHPCGEDTAQDLGRLLFPGGVAVLRAAVYRANLLDRLPPEAERALRLGEIDTVLFFSARAAAHFSRVFGAPRGLEAICISPRVAAALGRGKWRSVRAAQWPELESMLELLRAPADAPPAPPPRLEAQAVIAAFGGIRPLANHLGITASTVQGWQKRKSIPEGRIGDILAAAEHAGIDPDHLYSEAPIPMTPDDPPHTETPQPQDGDARKERRGGGDRRRVHTPPDEKGYIRTKSYTGMDRRTGTDRRAYHERKRQMVWREKMRFLNYTSVSLAFFLVAIICAVYFLLGPEIAKMDRDAARLREMESQMEALNARLEKLQAQQEKRTSIGGKINRAIEGAQNLGDGLMDAAGSLAQPAARATGADQLLPVLSHVQALGRTKEGRAALDAAMQRLKSALGAATPDHEGLAQAAAAARGQDPALDAILRGVDRENLGAAALLLAVNELRGNIDGQRPFAEDLALVRKFAGADPQTRAALERLAPYAESGVLSRAALQREFKGLAYDIVTAKLAGEDLTVKEAALARLSRFVQVRRIDDIEGDSPDAAVARAQRLLDKGDVRGAIRELEALDGAPAETAHPWMEKAAGHVMASESSAMLTQVIFKSLARSASSPTLTLEGMLQDFRDSLRPPAPPAYISPALTNTRRQDGVSPLFPAQ